MYKIISFSVWGNDKKYLNGCIENIKLSHEIYPGWQTRFYCDSRMDKSFTDTLRDMGAEVILENVIKSTWEGLFWRFKPAFEKDVDIFISRDIDSRLNEREQAAVKEWLDSDKDIHCMRDHIEHNVPILGGMWGCKNGFLKNIKDKINEWQKYDYKGSDQDFLRTKVWDKYKDKFIVHDRFDKGFITEEIVLNVEEYRKQREEQSQYRIKTIVARDQYKRECLMNGIRITNDSELDEIFPNVPEVSPEKYNSNGQLIYDYFYDPIKFFGEHDIRPFPEHEPMKHGTHVGEIIT
jgi:hypothetical protein